MGGGKRSHFSPKYVMVEKQRIQFKSVRILTKVAH